MTAEGTHVTGMSLVAVPERVEAALWRRLGEGAHEAGKIREALFSSYRPLARGVARRHARTLNSGVAAAGDLEQAAYEALLQAIDRFDANKGVPFPAFARPRITGSVRDCAARFNEAGVHARHRNQVERERLRSLGEIPPSSRDASALSELADIVTQLALSVMLDMQEANEVPFEGRRDNAFDSLAWRQLKMRLSKSIAELSDQERLVVRHHYEDEMLFTDIATMLGVTRGRVSQIHKAALQRLAAKMRGTSG